MSGTLLVRGARQLITLRGPAGPRRGAALREIEVIREGALLIKDGEILDVGTSRRVENLASSHHCREIDAAGRVVMPGFVDCHAHLFPGLAAAGGETVLPAWQNASGKVLESRARRYMESMVRHGITTFEARAGCGLDLRTELKALRAQARLQGSPAAIVSTFLPSPETWDASASDPERHIAWVCSALLPAIRGRSLARFVSLPAAVRAHAYLAAARELGLRVKIDVRPEDAAHAVRAAIETGASTIDYLADASPEDPNVLARTGTIAVLLPGAIFESGERWQGPRRLIDEGAAVALGTNFCPGASPLLSPPAAIALACTRLGMTPAEALCAATYNAACALGCARVAGSLEVGKPADFILLNAQDYREIGSAAGVNLVHRTVKHGITVYEEGAVAPRA